MGIRTVLNRTLARQLGNPHGLLGPLIARVLNNANRVRITAAVDALELRPDDVVADLGFGGGFGLSLLLDRGHTVHGVDFSSAMVRRAARRWRSGRLRLHTGSITAIPLGDDSVDAVITVNTIYFIEDLGAAFGELARILRPGGRAVVGMGEPSVMAAEPFTEHGFRLRPVSEVIETLAAAGLAVTDHRRVGNDERGFHLLVVTQAISIGDDIAEDQATCES
jgi:SAM-dependent methyltransferase